MIQAVADRIFIRLKEPKPSSLILTDHQEGLSNRGVVESFGPLVHSVHIGDEILFHAFDELPSFDKNVVVIRESSILGIYQNE